MPDPWKTQFLDSRAGAGFNSVRLLMRGFQQGLELRMKSLSDCTIQPFAVPYKPQQRRCETYHQGALPL
jgi:hypothetical protein